MPYPLPIAPEMPPNSPSVFALELYKSLLVLSLCQIMTPP